MADGHRPAGPNVFAIPAHRSFADSLAAGLLRRYGSEPMSLAAGRILLPNGRAVRTLTEAFVRASGTGLILPRLIAIGDPELDDRIGGALDPAGRGEPVPPAIDPLDRRLALAAMVRGPGETAAEAIRLAADLARALDQLMVEEVSPSRLSDVAGDDPELAIHWQKSLDRLQAILIGWPEELKRRGYVDLTDRRNRLLRQTALQWQDDPPKGFTVAAGITTSVPSVAALLKVVANLEEGMVILPALAGRNAMPDEEWDALGPDPEGRGEESHPQFHLKVLLERMGVARDEVQAWRIGGRASARAVRSRAIANAMVAARFSDKWEELSPPERRLSGIRAAAFADPASEALGIAIAIREALETPGKTIALVSPDRSLAERVVSQLGRWEIAVDDSAGTPLSRTPSGAFILAALSAAAEQFAPVALLALLKHPLAGGKGEQRKRWLADVRLCDIALRGPRPASGLAGLDRHFDESVTDGAKEAWKRLRRNLEPVNELAAGDASSLGSLSAALRTIGSALTDDQLWTGPDGRASADLVSRIEAATDSALMQLTPEDWVPVYKAMMDEVAVRPPYGGHPRVAVLGLLEARLHQPDLVILGGLNEGTWPALPKPDPWLAPKVRSMLGLPGLEYRIGLSAHDFASALGAPSVLITRSRRDSRSPTVASRFWLRLEAMTGGLPRDRRLEHYVASIDDPGVLEPVARPQPAPPAGDRPRDIWVTQVDRLKADPFAFYARSMLRLKKLDPVDADLSAAWKGSAVHEVLDRWFKDDDCNPDVLIDRAKALVAGDAIHPMLRALWQPRLLEAIEWIAGRVRENRGEGRLPVATEAEGKTAIGGVTLHGIADRIDRLSDGSLAIVDYKTGQPPTGKAVEAGFALQLGLLGLIARDGGYAVKGLPGAHEYWSLARGKDGYGKKVVSDKAVGAAAFVDRATEQFLSLAAEYLTGDRPFTAKLHPAYAPYGDYDQLMRLDEWYGRD